MTNHARKVLQDCHVALALLEQEIDLQKWRIHWVAAVALARAVGHILAKVDGADPDVKRVAAQAFRKWKAESELFREFIEGERNNVLKEYTFNQDPSEEVEILLSTTLEHIPTGQQVQAHHIIPVGDNIYRPMMEGFREGDDARDVLKDALDWWELELGLIDKAVQKIRAERAN